MHEDVLAPVIGQDEAEAAGGVVPFDHAVERFRWSLTIVMVLAAAAEAVLARRARLHRREVDLDDLGYRPAFRPLRPVEDDRSSIRRLAVSGALEHRQRQE